MRSHPSRRPTRGWYCRLGITLATVATVAIVAAVLPHPAQSQPSYAEAFDNCSALLLQVDETLVSGDVDAARNVLVAADDPCSFARESVSRVLRDPMTPPDILPLAEMDLVVIESQYSFLIAELGFCEEARARLRSLDAAVPYLPADASPVHQLAVGALEQCRPGEVSVVPLEPLDADDDQQNVVFLGAESVSVDVTGIAGGSLSLAAHLGSPCSGSASAQPTFELEVAYRAWVYLAAFSAGDLTMGLSGPNSAFCNDDFEGLNPAIYQFLEAGTYAVWIGEYQAHDTGTPFWGTFAIEEIDLPTDLLDPTQPTHGAISISPDMDQQIVSGLAGGERTGDEFGAHCVGFYGDAPTAAINLIDSGTVSLLALAENDLTLVLSGQGETYCNDDFVGLNPGLLEFLSPGSYQVWVGTLRSAHADSAYDLLISWGGAHQPEVRPDADSSAYGSVVLSPGAETHMRNAIVQGMSPASTHAAVCNGFLDTAPTFLMDLTADAVVDVSVSSHADPVLVIDGPSGVFCNDDSVGLDPRIETALSQGRYQVWVGTYQPGDYISVFTHFSAR